MSRDLYIGIDPGRKGAIAVVRGDELVDWLSFHKLFEEWECGVVMMKDLPIMEFLARYTSKTQTLALEVPKMTSGFRTKGGTGISLEVVAGLRGQVCQMLQITNFMSDAGISRRLVDPQTWQKSHGFRKTPNKDVKTVVKESFESSVKHTCKFAYQIEGVADAYYVALWAQAQAQLDALSCA